MPTWKFANMDKIPDWDIPNFSREKGWGRGGRRSHEDVRSYALVRLENFDSVS